MKKITGSGFNQFKPLILMVFFTLLSLVSCGRSLRVISDPLSCSETPSLSIKRLFPETNDVAAGSDVLWEVGASSQCGSQFVLNYDQNGQTVQKTLSGGKVIFSKHYPSPEEVTEEVVIIVFDGEGNAVTRDRVRSAPFRVGNPSPLQCHAASPVDVRVLLNSQGQFIGEPPTAEFLLDLKRNGNLAYSQVSEVRNPLGNFSLLDAIPSSISQSHLVRAAFQSVGYHPFIFTLLESPNASGPANPTAAARCVAPVFVSGIEQKPPQAWSRARSGDERSSGSPKALNVPYNATVEISWFSINSQNCQVSPLNRTDLGGVYTVSNITATQTYTINCSNAIGQASDSVTVQISATPAQAPQVDLKVKKDTASAPVDGPLSIPYGTSASLTWTSQNVSTCELKKSSDELISNATQETVGRPTGNLTSNNETYSITCSGASGNASDAVTVNVDLAPPTDHVIFVSSTSYSGNLGGTAGADQKCKDLAAAAKIRADRPWKAVLSTDAEDAVIRIKLAGPIYNPVQGNSLRKVDDATTLFKGNLQRVVIYNELGASAAGNSNVWTGTNGDGLRFSGLTCGRWTSASNAQKGVAGGSAHASGQWLSDSNNEGNEPCDELKRIYCISQ